MYAAISAGDAGQHLASLSRRDAPRRIAPVAELRPTRRHRHPLASLARQFQHVWVLPIPTYAH